MFLPGFQQLVGRHFEVDTLFLLTRKTCPGPQRYSRGTVNVRFELVGPASFGCLDSHKVDTPLHRIRQSHLKVSPKPTICREHYLQMLIKAMRIDL